jgi:hypothetical protein
MIKKLLGVFALLFINFQGVLASPPNIFGLDNRKPMNARNYPWSTIGKVESTMGSCTGSLVGDDLVLTAAHCIFNESGETVSGPIVFRANVVAGEETLVSVVKEAYVDGIHDWAVLRLKDPLGEKQGYLGVAQMTDKMKIVISVGYSFDFDQGETASVHAGCFMEAIGPGQFHHNCDQNRGASGGPMIVQKDGLVYVVAIHVAEHIVEDEIHFNSKKELIYSDDTANHAVDAAVFMKVIEKLRKEPEVPVAIGPCGVGKSAC